MSALTYLFVILLISLILIVITKRRLSNGRQSNSVAFFHLYCSSGGGGERVLWHTIKAILERYPKYNIIVYCHNDVGEDVSSVLETVKRVFKIDLTSHRDILTRLRFVPLGWSPIVEARNYKHLTLFFQNFMSMILAIQAALKVTPEIYVETIGFTFTLYIFKSLGCKVLTYVHYPTISSEMICKVQTSTTASFNNKQIFVRSPLLRRLKVIYYKMLALMYGYAGRKADLVMVNSSWTKNHIDFLWSTKANVLYPPCDVTTFRSVCYDSSRHSRSKALKVMSLAQFRPEKSQIDQIHSFDKFLSETRAYESKLTLYGSCRNQDDHQLAESLKDLARTLEIDRNVEIVVNAPFSRLLEAMKGADVALHTMRDEHFGIVLVEFMAAGLITVAHNSGGPKTDIIDDGQSGFLADDADKFAEILTRIHKMDAKERQRISEKATNKSERFKVEFFEQQFIKLVDPFFK